MADMEKKEEKLWFEPDEKMIAKDFTLEDFEKLCKMFWDEVPPQPHIIGECVMLEPKPHRVFLVENPHPVGTPSPVRCKLPEGCVTLEAYYELMKKEEEGKLPTQYKAGPDPELCYPVVTPKETNSRNNQ